MKVQLTNRQRKIIQKVVKIQLRSLHSILSGDTEEDIDLYCAENEIERSRLMGVVRKNIEEFVAVYRKPEYFLSVSKNHQSTMKHILVNYVKKSEDQGILWRKLVVSEDLLYNPN